MPLLTLAHSPDPDDAFMWWPLLSDGGQPPAIDGGRFRFVAVPDDIERLNARAESGLFDITAISVGHYPRVADRYDLTACGSSVGDGYGPKLVAREALPLEALLEPGAVVAVPGVRTTAFLATSLLLGPGRFRFTALPFDRIESAVAAGEVTAGVVIHEGQLTFGRRGLVLLEDLGRWWTNRTGLPLPLGGNAIRRDLDRRFGAGSTAEVIGLLSRSIEHAFAHRDESVRYAMRFARGLDRATADEFVRLYVNQWTLDFGERGRAAVRALIDEAAQAGLVPPIAEVTILSR